MQTSSDKFRGCLDKTLSVLIGMHQQYKDILSICAKSQCSLDMKLLEEAPDDVGTPWPPINSTFACVTFQFSEM